jgi:eukaryotic-like serine/threonine-protein kinase
MGAPSPERWAALGPVLDRFVDLDPEQRPELLEAVCSRDPALRHDLELVLRALERAEEVLGSSAAAYAAPFLSQVAGYRLLAYGQRLGPYVIERQLGQGGMATVYLARDSRHDRVVALKVLRPELSATLGAERFVRETAIAARLNHPHILPLFDSGSFDDGSGDPVLYFCMPYVEGRSLRDHLRETSPLPVDAAVEIARQVAEALDHAHQHGIVHRDIKPENVLLSGEHAFVADFGIALALDVLGSERLTNTGLSLGTPAYMSPEQATTGRLDGRSDLYSLGCMLYEMLAGYPPFAGATAQAVLARHVADAAPLLRTVRPAVPTALERFIARSLSKIPENRFPTCQALAEALAAAAAAPTTAGDTVYAVVMSVVRAVRRPRVQAMMLAGGAAVIMAGSLVRATHSRTLALDRATVAVAPFRVNGADKSLGSLRDGMVDLLAARLGGTEALRPVEPQTILRARDRVSGGGSDLSGSQALALATQVRAGRLIEGEIVGSGTRLTISASLLDVASGGTLARATIEGPGDSLSSLVDRLAARMLALGAGQDESRVSSLAGTPLPALRAYLNGESLARRGSSDSAARSFQAALTADSTFSLAALRLLNMSWWPDVEDAAEQAAWRYRSRLSAQDRASLTATLGPRFPAPSTRREVIAAAEHFVQVAPESPEAWTGLGAALFDNGPLLDLPEAHARAVAAFARAVALDSTNVPALGLLSMAATARGDAATGRTALAALLRQRRDSTTRVEFEPEWFAAAVSGDTATLHRVLRNDSLTPSWGMSRPGQQAWLMMRLGLHQGLDLRDAEGVLDRALAAAATENQRASIRWNQGMLEAIRGRPVGRQAGPPVFPRSADLADPVFSALFMEGDSTDWDSVRPELLKQIGSLRADACCIPHFGAGEYALATNRLELAERAATDLRTYHGAAPDADSAFATPISHAYGVILEAQIAARRHDRAAAAWLRQLDSLLADPLDEWMPCWGNMVAARLHEARGELGAALVAMRRRSWGLLCPSYVVYHREEGRLAALTGDTTGAIRAYSRYLALRSDAEPRFQPKVQQVRSALAALQQASGRH